MLHALAILVVVRVVVLAALNFAIVQNGANHVGVGAEARVVALYQWGDVQGLCAVGVGVISARCDSGLNSRVGLAAT